MSPRRMRRALFLLALVAIPFPYAVVEGGRVPAAWLAIVAGMIAVSAVTQGGNVSALIARYFVLEALVVVAGAHVLARVAAFAIGRIVPADRQRIAVAVIGVAALAAALLPIFTSTAVRGGAPTNLLGMLGLW